MVKVRVRVRVGVRTSVTSCSSRLRKQTLPNEHCFYNEEKDCPAEELILLGVWLKTSPSPLVVHDDKDRL